MSTDSPQAAIAPAFCRQFVFSTYEEVGVDHLARVLTASGLSTGIVETEAIDRLDEHSAAELYALIQHALRTYYGRGARGILLRVGRNIWERILGEVSLRERAELEILRRLPAPARRRRVLEFTASKLCPKDGFISVHLMDTDFLLVDRMSAATRGQSCKGPMCHVTIGLIEAGLHWATGQIGDVEEIHCRAAGDSACEFIIHPGGS